MQTKLVTGGLTYHLPHSSFVRLKVYGVVRKDKDLSYQHFHLTIYKGFTNIEQATRNGLNAILSYLFHVPE
jgi:hypothetical protein